MMTRGCFSADRNGGICEYKSPGTAMGLLIRVKHIVDVQEREIF